MRVGVETLVRTLVQGAHVCVWLYVRVCVQLCSACVWAPLGMCVDVTGHAWCTCVTTHVCGRGLECVCASVAVYAYVRVVGVARRLFGLGFACFFA